MNLRKTVALLKYTKKLRYARPYSYVPSNHHINVNSPLSHMPLDEVVHFCNSENSSCTSDTLYEERPFTPMPHSATLVHIGYISGDPARWLGALLYMRKQFTTFPDLCSLLSSSIPKSSVVLHFWTYVIQDKWMTFYFKCVKVYPLLSSSTHFTHTARSNSPTPTATTTSNTTTPSS